MLQFVVASGVLWRPIPGVTIDVGFHIQTETLQRITQQIQSIVVATEKIDGKPSTGVEFPQVREGIDDQGVIETGMTLLSRDDGAHGVTYRDQGRNEPDELGDVVNRYPFDDAPRIDSVTGQVKMNDAGTVEWMVAPKGIVQFDDFTEATMPEQEFQREPRPGMMRRHN